MSRPKPVLLLILDGWGHREETAHNAIALADCPNWRKLLAECPHALVDTHGLSVGLPEGQMGNSEVGHMNIGSGRVVYQDLTRVDAAIADGSFERNPALRGACAAARDNISCLHVFGLLSPGGVHSHEQHILAMIDLAAAAGVERIAVHAFLDGRDTPPRSAADSLQRLQAKCDEHPAARIATLSGRYFAMDRDQRWDRVKLACEAIVDARAPHQAATAAEGLEAAYARGENDEFVVPTAIGNGMPMQDGDAVVFMNFRADRARQLSRVFVEPGFNGFVLERKPALSAFVTLTEYAADLPVTGIAFAAASMENTLGEVLAKRGLTQLRIAETEKYAHVTFFFSGGREAAFDGEQRILIPSPQVATYDLKPEMSLPELTDRLVAEIRAHTFDFIACNVANADMVGHSGVEPAAIKAAEAIDLALGRIVEAIRESGGEMLISADHGNLEQMVDDRGVAHTQHTVGPVPLVYVGRKARLHNGALRDLAPSVLALMGIEAPAEMTGHSLVEFID
ncbi:2,3-bisphosphoglycerate-independent phosphoglycerate mutase [Dokdonella sp.]|uniref:2,3-bisphosphoglycerate-independent phosphoglycerate mutase n=1 Tax=Dokdonella sp. TaxID=2291710 RepID=UPI003527BC7C